MATPVANARMYSVNAEVKADWRLLFEWVLGRAGLDWPVIDHDSPAPMSLLWQREDLGLAMMCGLPYARREPRPLLVAAPVPAPARYQGLPRYCTDIVVRADESWTRLEDSFGAVVGYTVEDSLSGGVAPALHFESFRRPGREQLYRAAVDGLIHARGVVEALRDRRIDVGPLDCYYHDLLRRHEPELVANVRVIDHTAWRPIPPLVATAAITAQQLHSLREALQASASAPELSATMDRLLLAGFAVPAAADYDYLASASMQHQRDWPAC